MKVDQGKQDALELILSRTHLNSVLNNTIETEEFVSVCRRAWEYTV
jgi:hypothetical protein